MPPRYTYWTIIVDGLPTAFRAGRRDELLPTFERLRQKHPAAVMRWFARGRLWESPEEAAHAQRPTGEPRATSWRPGGRHEDPRERFKKPRRARAERDRREGRQDQPTQDHRDARREVQRAPRAPYPTGPRADRPQHARPWSDRPPTSRRHGGGMKHSRPPQGAWRPGGAGPGRKPGPGGNRGDAGTRERSRGDRHDKPWGSKPRGDHPNSKGSGRDRPVTGSQRGSRPPGKYGESRVRPEDRRDEFRKRGETRDRRPGQPPRSDRPFAPRERPKSPPPGPDRPPRRGEEPKPLPNTPDDVIVPSPPPERGQAVKGPEGTRLIKPRRHD